MTFSRPLISPFNISTFSLSWLLGTPFCASLSDLQTAAARSLTWSCRPSSTDFLSPCLQLATGDVSGLWRSGCICPPAQVYPRSIGDFWLSSLKSYLLSDQNSTSNFLLVKADFYFMLNVRTCLVHRSVPDYIVVLLDSPPRVDS
ncbi:uncharacterized protein BO97DRAFT_26419 [Aspergillus homomorphus CBS 101889]|uniref:Uncharacterized protein n=1 Tax=Aspergillus homomorphus (strain CBS 101889) TaxID=1450537 RepID=A0A395I248_ASPHC|nr:hypothetical protein BO97DRAFT_26419 [Aspergillus homomorphus CBS 101889]RAL13805.1 hypothetical protein BO97DRAFT_26419 [Aspergillus homomorphus CBS 101889]